MPAADKKLIQIKQEIMEEITMKKTVKMLSIMMAMLMVLSLGLTACGSKAEEPADDG